MAVRGVDDEHVDARFDERRRALPGLTEVADGGADEQAAFGVLRGVRKLLGLHEVLHGDERDETPVVVDERQALTLVLTQDRRRVVVRDVDGSGDERLRRHDVAHLRRRPLRDGREAQVAVGDHADELVVLDDDGQPGDAVLAADRVELFERLVGADRHGVRDAPRLRALDEVDLVGLILDRQVAVQHTHATLARHGNRHARFGDGVHRRRNERNVEGDLARQLRRRVDLGRDDVGLAGQQQNVVVGEAQRRELRGNVSDIVRTESHSPSLGHSGPCPHRA